MAPCLKMAGTESKLVSEVAFPCYQDIAMRFVRQFIWTDRRVMTSCSGLAARKISTPTFFEVNHV